MDENLKFETLLVLYFGNYGDYQISSLNRAFRDFSRTLRVKNLDRTDYLKRKNDTSKILLKHLNDLINNKLKNQEEFDDFHKKISQEVKESWDILTYGQIQKWINMTLKYWLLIGEMHIKNIELNSRWFHIPIDNLVLINFLEVKYPKISWSKMDYKMYFNYQIKLRNIISSNNSLIIEETIQFNKWMAK